VSRRGRIVRPALRFVASVLITSGVLLLADAGLTLAWQEPISAYLAQLQQDKLGNELDSSGTRDLVRQEQAAVASIRDAKRRIAKLAAVERKRAKRGRPIGRIDLPTLHRHYVVVQGTDDSTLRKGPGHYPGTSFPGQGKTTAIAGHRTTYLDPFRTINQLRPGDPIVMKMPYATFTYRVEKTQVVKPDALWITHPVKGEDRLVLSACHPLYSASHRIIAFARLVGETEASPSSP
jgi:sortase A